MPLCRGELADAHVGHRKVVLGERLHGIDLQAAFKEWNCGLISAARHFQPAQGLEHLVVFRSESLRDEKRPLRLSGAPQDEKRLAECDLRRRIFRGELNTALELLD